MLLLLAVAAPRALAQHREQSNDSSRRQLGDRARIFEEGQGALAKGDLKEAAAQAFRTVLKIDPNSVGAYANLGVVYMREKRWDSALTTLRKAERLAPGMAGIRLNIGLAFYRQNMFQTAIPAFRSVVKDDPNSIQARYLLGLCYFFTKQYGDAVNALEPLEPTENGDPNFLCVLSISAWKSQQPELEQRAMARLVEVGGDSPEFHLLMGKAHLNQEEYDEAIKELQIAEQASPKLPFVHFNLGEAYMKKQEFAKATREFVEDATIEPDSAFNYDQLGVIAFEQQCIASLPAADPGVTKIIFSFFGNQLARVYLEDGSSTRALAEVDSLLRMVPDNSSAHYLRGQILERLGRTEEAKAEMRQANQISNSARAKRQQELEGGVQDPQLMEQTAP